MGMVAVKRVIEVDPEGLNRGELARMTGYHRSHISRVLSGHRRPSIACTVSLSTALGVSIEEFLIWWIREFGELSRR